MKKITSSKDIRNIIDQERWSIAAISRGIKDTSVSNASYLFNSGNIKLKLAIKILDFIGYDLVAVKRKE